MARKGRQGDGFMLAQAKASIWQQPFSTGTLLAGAGAVAPHTHISVNKLLLTLLLFLLLDCSSGRLQ